MKEKVLRTNLYFGLSIFLVSSLLLVLEMPFMKSWYFCFAWWSFLLFMDSVNVRRTGTSPLSVSFSGFVLMAYLSVPTWIVFELFNLRLHNWAYHSLPSYTPERWLGYGIAFATVIPALKELSLFFTSILKGKKLSLFRIKPGSVFLTGSVVMGGLSLFLSLMWPGVFFPLIWLGFIFIFEPVNFWLRNDSFLQDLYEGRWTRLWAWILAGLAAGCLWELWNFCAGSHWEYSLPYLDFGRVFHMPVLGYTGFMPFALEIFALISFFSFLEKRLKPKLFMKVLILVALGVFCTAGFYLIDRFTLVR